MYVLRDQSRLFLNTLGNSQKSLKKIKIKTTYVFYLNSYRSIANRVQSLKFSR